MSVTVAALLLTAAPAARGGEPTRASSAPAATVDAELLLNLDLLDSADYRRDREVARRQGLLERLRLLESQRMPPRGADPAGDGQAPGAAARPPGRSPGPPGVPAEDPSKEKK